MRESNRYDYTFMVEIVDRMAENGIAGPYPVLHTNDLKQAEDEIEYQNRDAYTHSYLRRNH